MPHVRKERFRCLGGQLSMQVMGGLWVNMQGCPTSFLHLCALQTTQTT